MPMFKLLKYSKWSCFYPLGRKLAIILLLLLLGISKCPAQSKGIETAGDVLLFTLPTLALGSTIIKDDRVGTRQFTKGFFINQGVTLGLKFATDKNRPYDNGTRAFPSGHTSTTFQAASFVQRRYGWKYGLPMYALAGFTGYSRVNAQRHDTWDVLAGAVIGIGSTYLFTTPYQQEHMALTFRGGKGEFLLGFQFQF